MARVVSAAGLAAVLLLGALACAPAEARVRAKDNKRYEPASAIRPTHPQGPLQIVVSIGSQRLMVYDRDRLIETSTISTGVGGYPTPTGVFSVIDKEATHYSNIYRGASMPFMQRLTMSGVALHSGQVTGRPASHGCIRLPHAFAIRLFAITRLGARVMIASGEPAPVAIEHPRLFRPMRAPTEADPAADLSGPAKVAVASALELQTGAAEARKGPGTLAREAALRALPVSVFVSKAEGRVFVRHAFQPLFDAPAAFRDPERRLGTHVYTAVDTGDDDTGMRWTVVSLSAGERAAGDAGAAARRLARGPAYAAPADAHAASPLSPADAREALDRIELPADAVARISAMLSTGATLIVSDHGHNREMRAKGTDFIVLTK